MNVTVEEVSPTRKALLVSVSTDEVNAQEKAVTREYTQGARLPGFRPGKAPADMVKRRYGKEISDELHRKVANLAYEHAVKESKLNVYSLVTVEGEAFAAGKEGSAKFIVDVLPEIPLAPYEGLPVQTTTVEVTDAEADQAIKELRDQRAEYLAVERAAAAGDFVKLNYTGTIDGKPVAEIAPDRPIFGTQHGTWEEAAAPKAPGVRAVIDGIVGMKTGDKKDVTQSFSADFEVPALAGKTASYAIEVLEVREKRPAALDEAFLKSLQCESAEQLHTRVKDDLKSRKEQQAQASTREQIVKALTEAVDFPLPDSAVEHETQSLLRDYIERQMRQGVPEGEFEKRKQELYNGARTAAASRVKLSLILLRIAEKEGLKVENTDLHQRIMQESVMTRQRPEVILKQLQENRSLLAQMQRGILQAKTLDFVASKAKTSPAVAV